MANTTNNDILIALINKSNLNHKEQELYDTLLKRKIKEANCK